MDAESIERVYKNYASFYDILFGKIFHKARYIAIDNLNIKSDQKILDVGIGTGLSLTFYPKNCKVTGIDFCESMLRKCQKKVKKFKLNNIELKKMDATKMEFEDNAFDSIIATYVITAVPDPEQVISEMTRVCKDGGEIIILNHFMNGNKILSKIEKGISPLCKRLGFRTDLTLESVINGTALKVVKKEKVKPLNYWKVVKCINQKE